MKWIFALRETIPVFLEGKREALITNFVVSPWRADLRRNLPTLLWDGATNNNSAVDHNRLVAPQTFSSKQHWSAS